MSDSTPSPLERREPATADVTPAATPPPGEASAAVERRRSRSGTAADASPGASAPASAASGSVPRHPIPQPSGAEEASAASASAGDGLASLPPLARSRQRRRSLAAPAPKAEPLHPEQRLLLLDTWQRSGLPAADFAALVGISKFTLFAWKKKFEQEGPAGLLDKPKGTPPGSRLPELTKRTILMLKQANPAGRCEKISDFPLGGRPSPPSPGAGPKAFHEPASRMEKTPPPPPPPRSTRFERAKPNQLWQTDLFTFMLKRQNR